MQTPLGISVKKWYNDQKYGIAEVKEVENQGLFKTTLFSGFEKKSVLKYIDELNAQSNQAQESLNNRIQELITSREELTTQIGQFEVKIAQLEERCV